MDNTKTGAFIRELRKERELTQKALASLLHITDRAVSKWERGLCAPDIALLEPLANALDTSIAQLIKGERVLMDGHAGEIEATTKNVIDYSKNEIVYKTRTFKKKYFLATGICIAVAISICLLSLWWSGYFNIIDRNASPDGSITITVYNRDIFRVLNAPAVAIRTWKSPDIEYRTVYSNRSYQGIWWAPDSKKYVVGLKAGDGMQLELNNMETSSVSNLNVYLSTGVAMNELAGYGLPYDEENVRLVIEYQFLQWSTDSTAMLIYYSFTDTSQELHSGYFWYSCEDGHVYAPFEVDDQEAVSA